ncbi:MAG: hypothetical protein P4L27_11930 [Ignavibacteriaceae bacterium]|nr:hypothetical protein [Ignavibacteriaceae bacterium]
MNETILNIYLIIEKGYVIEYRANAYETGGDDEDKIKYLKARVKDDFSKAYRFDALSDKYGRFMKYNKFAKLEDRGKHPDLYEEIFSKFNIPDRPLICVTPVVDGIIITND